MNTETSETEATTEEETKLNLSVDVKETSACERHVTVTVPREDIERYFSKQFDDLVPKAEVPGFRVGKAPRKLVEKKFRKQLSNQVKGSLIMDSLSQVSDTQDFSAISEPDLDFEQVNIPEEGDLTYEFNIEVRPEFDIPNWKGLKLERPEHEFTDDDISDHLKSLSNQFSDMAPVDEAIKADDYAVCNITSILDGETINSQEEVVIQVRPTLSLSDGTIEAFDELMVGASAEDKKTAKVEISEHSENEDLRGKTVEVEFEILDVKRMEGKEPEEIAKQLGIESVEKLQELVRSSMEERLQYAQRETIREQISLNLTESATWELPPDLLRRQSKRELDRSVMEMRSSGFSEQEIIARENTLRKNILEKTETLLKEHFILERIAEEEKVEDEPADYEIEIARIAMQQNDSPRRVRARLERTGQMDSLRNMIIERKVIEQITENATFKGTDYETTQKEDSAAVNYFAAGHKNAIPEAKYDGGEAEPIPGIKSERD
ncbi:MAG: trigger factor [Mariniblastus sp.]|nr:trigger factor [Mariniblastus sp.]